ncbi:DNA-directed RNA polymerase subunit epsilon [Haladaptatus sp. W1]|uniref:DNA-directed RNA polymerase subunit epsilon n=1 Tax=Haladaptatus sp. W1 TaxID=1897478 RepID=UPI000849B522|nr:DNA-directed RNA polymerase subunit epsilon [Haladaptatus sp. W1]ODR83231.1 DNA-directed RNA polymerase subunit epsilon [Haladaptatus sp. W1]
MRQTDGGSHVVHWQSDDGQSVNDDTPLQLSRRPGDGTVRRADLQRDQSVRRWGPVTPSATVIGRADSPESDLSENVRRLHEERHSAMAGHSSRMHQLDKLRVSHALCNDLSLTPWQRDCVIGIMSELDLTVFGSQRAIPKVALVVIRHVVDREREHYLGLHDDRWIRQQPPERLTELYESFQSLTDEEQFTELATKHGLDITSLNRLRRVLKHQIEEQDLEFAVHGRNPHRDPNLPSLTDRWGDDERRENRA